MQPRDAAPKQRRGAWWRIMRRVAKARRWGHPIRVQHQVVINGEPTWMYLGEKR